MKNACCAVIVAATLATMSTFVLAQGGGRPASPAGSAVAQVGGKYEPGAEGPVYKGDFWIEITYGRPLLRGRDPFGAAGPNYGKIANPDAPVWRAGANNSTQLKTDVPLSINNKSIAPGTYTMFIDLKPNNWTLIVSNWKAQQRYNPGNKEELWGAYEYTPDKDVVRAPMTLASNPMSVEQLTWAFNDVTDAGGKISLLWGKQVATVPFKVVAASGTAK